MLKVKKIMETVIPNTSSVSEDDKRVFRTKILKHNACVIWARLLVSRSISILTEIC